VGLGVLSLLNLIYDLVVGHRVMLDLGIVLLPCAGFGLLDGRNGWRIFCLVCSWIAFLFLALAALALFFQPLPDWISWLIVSLAGLIGGGLALWTNIVVRRPDVRAYCAFRTRAARSQ